jgi:hypothetical protein
MLRTPLSVKLAAALIVSVTLCGGCVRDALLPANSAVDDFPSEEAAAISPDSPLGREIVASFHADAAQLAPFGVWSSDRLYVEKWCPAGPGAAAFVPYRSHGHWAAPEAVDGSPFWVENSNAAPWEDLTLHHGWWVRRSHGDASWCWIPGLSPTPAQVAWRSRDGYVGWAPLPPVAEDDDDGPDDDDLEWSFTLAGDLLDDALSSQILSGDDADEAADHTRRSREERHEDHAWHGPSRGDVTVAKNSPPPAKRFPVEPYRGPSEPSHGQSFSGSRVASSRGSSYSPGSYSSGSYSARGSGPSSHGSGSYSHSSSSYSRGSSSSHSSSSEGCGGGHSSSVAHANYPHR